ncbi:hypothetical protein TRVA0_020S00826 [Trichomonascus vanleenenianus]|uniref:uncharacterized protein n=1 Tax=Trichomonascus vanleenenianus TaxID=2268995 RepID=UPI003ECBAB44
MEIEDSVKLLAPDYDPDEEVDENLESMMTPYIGSYTCKCAKRIFLVDHCCEKITMVFKDWNFREFAKAILDGKCQEVLQHIRCVSINSRYYYPPSTLIPTSGDEIDDLRDHVVFNWFMKHAIPQLPSLERVDIQTTIGRLTVDRYLDRLGNPVVCDMVRRLRDSVEVNFDLELAREWERFSDRVVFKNTRILTISVYHDDVDFRSTRLFCGLQLPSTIEKLVITDRTEDKPPPSILPPPRAIERRIDRGFTNNVGQEDDEEEDDPAAERRILNALLERPMDHQNAEEEEEEEEEDEDQFDGGQENLIIPPHVFHDFHATQNQLQEESRGIPANDLRDFLAPCTNLRDLTIEAPVVNRDQINWLPSSVTDFVMDDSSVSIGGYEAPNVVSFQAIISPLGSEYTVRYFRFNSLKRLFLNFYIGSPEPWFGAMVAEELLSHNPGLIQLRTQNVPYDVIAALVRSAPNLQSLIVHSASKANGSTTDTGQPTRRDDPGQCYAHLSAIARGTPHLRFLALDALAIANYHQFVDCIGAFLVYNDLQELYLNTTDCDIGRYRVVPQGMLLDESSVIMFPGVKQLDIAHFKAKYRFRDDAKPRSSPSTQGSNHDPR